MEEDKGQQSDLSREHESSGVGKYSPNRAFIRLKKRSAFWKVGVSSSPKEYAVFLHEYTHYLHNFSTVAGISDFLYELRAAQFFLMTVGADGTSAGLSDLQPPAQQEYVTTQQLRGALRGDFNLRSDTDIHKRNVQLEYVNHTVKEEIFNFPNQSEPVKVSLVDLSLKIGSASAPSSTTSVKFGTMFLIEGVAFELECLFLERRSQDIQAHCKDVPPAPYMVARRVLEGIIGKPISHELCIQTCLLALQATDAGAQFVGIAAILKNAPRGDLGAEVTRLTRETRQEIQRELPRLTDAIHKSTAPFAQRKLINEATLHLANIAITYITQRTKELFFELDLVKFDPKSPALSAFLSRFPPCMIQVVDNASIEPDPLEFAIPLRIPQTLVDSLAAYHSMMHFGLTHFVQNIPGTDLLKPKSCPFLSSCSLPLKRDHPDICEGRPWDSFDPLSDTSCWYAAGVAVSRGRRN